MRLAALMKKGAQKFICAFKVEDARAFKWAAYYKSS